MSDVETPAVARPATRSGLTSVEESTLLWVQAGEPDLPFDEQVAEAKRIAAALPQLREPTQPDKPSDLSVPMRVSRFALRLRNIDASDRRRISGMVSHEKRELFRYYKLRYVRSALTDYRSTVRKAFGESHPAVRYLHLSVSDQNAVNTVDRAQVRLRHTRLRPIDPELLIDTAIALIDNERASVYDLGVGLALLTGRRPVELYKFAAFEYVDDEHVRFSGQAKKKSKIPGAAAPEAPPFVIPVLTHAELVIDAFRRMRQLRPMVDETPERINSLVGKQMLSVVARNRLEDQNYVRLQVKELRAAYAEIAWLYFCPPHVSKHAFFSQILGHEDTDEISALSYMKFYVLGHIGDSTAANENAKRDMLVTLLRDRDRQTDDYAKTLREKRIADLEAVMEPAMISLARARAGDPASAADNDRTRIVRALADGLSPAQERLLRDVANGRTVPAAKERKTLDILCKRELLELEETDSRILVALTDLGAEVRAVLANVDPLESVDVAQVS